MQNLNNSRNKKYNLNTPYLFIFMHNKRLTIRHKLTEIMSYYKTIVNVIH